jgi:chorismate-pyruvate lyase
MQNPLKHDSIDLSALSAFHRILLTTDGTLTEILQAYSLEQIKLVKLSERVFPATEDIPSLDVTMGDEIIERKILLQGERTERNFIYAESIIVVDRVDESMKDDLLKSKMPLGRLWLKHRMETFKEMIDLGRKPANGLSSYFNIRPKDLIFFRTYRVFSNRKPVILITEKFPDNEFYP